MSDNGKEKVTLTIDGREVTVDKGTNVLEAAKSVGIEIPYFCWHPKLDSVGACRMCLVAIEKIPKPAVACATAVMPDIAISSTSENVCSTPCLNNDCWLIMNTWILFLLLLFMIFTPIMAMIYQARL